MDPLLYNRVNRDQLRHGNQLVDKACQNFQDSSIEYIVDIGCGTGNVTIALNRIANNIKRIYAIDIDQQMIEFAKQNNSGDNNNNNNIEYLTQDFGVEWNQLRPELKAIEGKVSIIFSNYCLHWIYHRKDNISENMLRLLSKNGMVYLNLALIPPPTEKIKNRIFEFLVNRFSPIPTKEEQEDQWTGSFRKAGLEIIEFEYKVDPLTFETNDMDQNVAQLYFRVYYQFYGKYLTDAVNRLGIIFGFKPSSKLQQFTDEATGQRMCVVDFKTYEIVLMKKMN